MERVLLDEAIASVGEVDVLDEGDRIAPVVRVDARDENDSASWGDGVGGGPELLVAGSFAVDEITADVVFDVEDGPGAAVIGVGDGKELSEIGLFDGHDETVVVQGELVASGRSGASVRRHQDADAAVEFGFFDEILQDNARVLWYDTPSLLVRRLLLLLLLLLLGSSTTTTSRKTGRTLSLEE